MNKKILTNTIVIVIFMTTSMTIPLVSAQQNDTQILQDVLKAGDMQALIGPTDRVINVICPENPAPGSCQVFEGTQVRGPTDPEGELMAEGDTLLTAICPSTFTNPNQCQLLRGERAN